MAFFDRRLVGLLGFVAIGGVLPGLGACADDKSAIMLAISTDMRAPKDVNAVGVTVFTNDTLKFSTLGRVTPEGEILLPATLAIAQPDDPNATVRIRVIAFQDKKPRVMRDVRTTIAKGGRVALLRIPLNFANDGMVTGELPDGVLPAANSSSTGTASLGTLANPPGVGSYDPTLFASSCDDPTETPIAGECVDARVDWSSLPDFAPSDVGRASDPATCFDIDECFHGAPTVAEAGTSGVTLDRTTCSLNLHGADPSRVSVALVTPETGWCLSEGNCYVPLDRNSAGWTESADTIKLPAYVCRLMTEKSLRLVQASATCTAKTASRAVCAGGTDVASDGGADAGASALVSAEDFVTSIAIAPDAKSTLYSAGSARIARIDLGSKTATALETIASKTAWRFGTATTGALLTAGTATGRLLSTTAPSPTPVTLPAAASDATDGASAHVWGTPFPSYSVGASTNANAVTGSFIMQATAVTHLGSALLFGENSGKLTVCTVDGNGILACTSATATLPSSLPIDGLAEDPSSSGLAAWVLASDGVHYATLDAGRSTLTVGLPVYGDKLDGVDDGGIHLRSTVIGAGACGLVATGTELHAFVRTGPSSSTGPVLAQSIHFGDHPLLGAATDGTSAYFSVYAAASDGGGIYRVALPAQCIP